MHRNAGQWHDHALDRLPETPGARRASPFQSVILLGLPNRDVGYRGIFRPVLMQMRLSGWSSCA